MSAFGPAIAQSIAGLPNAALAQAKPAARRELRKPAARKHADEFESALASVEDVDPTQPVRDLKPNDQEDAAQDHTAHRPGLPSSSNREPRPSIDLRA